MSIPVTIKNTCYLEGDLDGITAEATMKGFEDEKILDMTVRELLAGGLAAFEVMSTMMPMADLDDVTEDFVNDWCSSNGLVSGDEDDDEA